MKVLRIYDHLGELKKEFSLYVEGEDFKWQSSYPEVVWLGTIALEELGKEPEAEPTPESEEETEEEIIEDSEGKQYSVQVEKAVEPEPMVAIDKVEEEPEKPTERVSGLLEQEPKDYLNTKVRCTNCDFVGTYRDCNFGHDDFHCPTCFWESLKEIKGEEVKDAPENLHGKRSRVKRSTSLTGTKRSKGLSKGNPGRDTTKGN